MLLGVKLTKRLQVGQTNESFNLGRVEGRNIKQSIYHEIFNFQAPTFAWRSTHSILTSLKLEFQKLGEFGL